MDHIIHNCALLVSFIVCLAASSSIPILIDIRVNNPLHITPEIFDRKCNAWKCSSCLSDRQVEIKLFGYAKKGLGAQCQNLAPHELHSLSLSLTDMCKNCWSCTCVH